jgi:hypothetical protein
VRKNGPIITRILGGGEALEIANCVLFPDRKIRILELQLGYSHCSTRMEIALEKINKRTLERGIIQESQVFFHTCTGDQV